MAIISVDKLASSRQSAARMLVVDYDKATYNIMLQAAVDELNNLVIKLAIEDSVKAAAVGFTPSQAQLDYIFVEAIKTAAGQI